MPNSQFTIYTATDIGGPGLLTGVTGSLINILNACLVNGYTSKSAAGWTKPFADISASAGSLPYYACFKQASGSQFTMFVNDNAPSGSAKEADVTGWLSMTSLSGSGSTSITNVGTGLGQFPYPGQSNNNSTLYSLIYGRVNIRKSNTADATVRYWVIAADAYTMYLWVLAGDIANTYCWFAFGDFYSLGGTSDLGRCMILGRSGENAVSVSNPGIGNDWGDLLVGSTAAWTSYAIFDTPTTLWSYGQPGHWIARPFSGIGVSVPFLKHGDNTLTSLTWHNAGLVPNYCRMDGALPYPNTYDSNAYLSYVWLGDTSNFSLRGKFRGIYQVCHLAANFSDGQILTGGGDFAGKTFMIINHGPTGGFWAVETSPTVITN